MSTAAAPTPDTVIDVLLDWHDPAARRLPWRAATDAYGVLVSEIMAQQTQAERAAVSWTAFMRRFPDVGALAAAPVGDVIQAWEGLGYNRRAVNLHRCAIAITTDHDGVVPDTLEALLALPGIGPYTARAVLAFAHDADVVPVDTNVARVLSRLHDRALTRPQAQTLADELTGRGVGPRLSAALMDLGASRCTSRTARCEGCPMRTVCRWAGGPGPDPAAAGGHRPRPQGTFAGSTRQARGRLVDAMREGPVDDDVAMQLAGSHGRGLLDRLVADGLAVRTTEGFALPGWSGKA